MNPDDLVVVREVVGQHRQRLSVAKAQLEEELGKRFCQKTLERFVKKTVQDTSGFDASPRVCRRTTTTRLKSSNCSKSSNLRMLEEVAERELVDIYYGDEAAICTQGSVCCGWQWKDEAVFSPAQRGARLSCFALLNRANRCRFATTTNTIDAAFVAQQLENLSLHIDKPTIVVLDNARLHKGTLIQSYREAWQGRGLFLFYLPVYSPHLNIVEILWKHLKYFWLCAEDYLDWQNLFYQVHQALVAVGSLLYIHFKPFNHPQLIPV